MSAFLGKDKGLVGNPNEWEAFFSVDAMFSRQFACLAAQPTSVLHAAYAGART